MEERLDVMTDYQMRTLMNLIIKIVMEKRDDVDEIIETLFKIRDGDFEKPEKKKPEA